MPARAALFHRLGSSVMIGAPRKSFIDWLHRDVGVTERLPGSLAAVLNGLQLIRVHDMAATAQAISIWRAVRAAPDPDFMGLHRGENRNNDHGQQISQPNASMRHMRPLATRHGPGP